MTRVLGHAANTSVSTSDSKSMKTSRSLSTGDEYPFIL